MATNYQSPHPAHKPLPPPQSQSLPPQSLPSQSVPGANYSYGQQQPPQQQQPQPQQQQQQQQQQQKPQLPNNRQPAGKSWRKSRTFSFRSDKSGHSRKQSLQETSAEKEARRLHSKADPTLAMSEAEPAEVAATVKASLAPLRSIQHKDAFGNPIADPDRSNPTRSRWERPLDTIRSFEAAIDGGYNSRRSYVRADSDSTMTRRKSNHYTHNAPRFPQGSYYSSRSNSFRPESQYETMRRPRERDGYFDREPGYNGAQYPNNTYHPVNRQRHAHTYTESGMSSQNDRGYRPRNGEPSVYPVPNANQRSYETVVSGGSGSGASEPVGYQTDPTSGSEDSSITRNNSPSKRSEPMNDYGINFNPVSSYQAPSSLSSSGANNSGPNSSYQTQTVTNGSANYGQQAPAVPPKSAPIATKPMAGATVPAATPVRPPPPEKRKSWFMRRFSKNS